MAEFLNCSAGLAFLPFFKERLALDKQLQLGLQSMKCTYCAFMPRSVGSESALSLWAETGPWVILVNHCGVPPLSVGPPAPGQSLCVNESKGQRGPKRRMFTQPQWEWLTPAYWMTGSADWRFTGWFYKHTEARLCSYFVGSEIPSTYLPYLFSFLSL